MSQRVRSLRPPSRRSPGTSSSRTRRRPPPTPDGIVDLSVGTPVDPVPELIQQGAGRRRGQPRLSRRCGARPSCGTRSRAGASGASARAGSPTTTSCRSSAPRSSWPGCRRSWASAPGDKVAYPRLAYPTYEVGARLARARAGRTYAATRAPSSTRRGSSCCGSTRPSNPTGRVLSKDELTRIVAWAREHGILVFSDECYIELGWEADPVSVLHPDVCGGRHEGIVAVHSLSKRSNLAGYRAAFLAGDAAVLGELLQIRKHGGMMRPAPVQAAMVAALGDDEHVGSSASATRPAARPCATPWRRRLPDRAQRGEPLPVGHARRVLLGHRRRPGRAGHPGGAGRVLRSRGRPLRPGGVHGDATSAWPPRSSA